MPEPIIDNAEHQTIKFIEDKLFGPAKNWKFFYAGDKHSKWIDDLRWYKGQQWSSKRPKTKSSVFFNRLFSTIQKEIPFMTDRRPTIYVEAQEAGDQVAADILKRIIENKWVESNMEIKLPECVTHAKQLGTGFFRPFWNPELGNGLGDIDCEVVDPLEAFPLSYTKNMETCEGFVWARYVSIGWVRKNFPKEGWRVKADYKEDGSVPDRVKDTNNASVAGYAQVTDTTGAETNYLPSPGGGSIEGNDFKRVLLIEAYLKDGSTTDVEEEMDDNKASKTKKKQKQQEAVYPNGRVITIANKTVLSDEPFPFEFFPGFVDMKNYINPSEFWGESDITMIKEGQKELNKLQAMIIDAVKRDVYRLKTVNVNSGIDADNFVVSADAVYPTTMQGAIEEFGQFSLPAQVLSYPEVIEQAIARTAGTQELSQDASKDMPSGRSLEQFQEITQNRLRLKLRNMESAIRKVGKAWLEMILKNYTEQRIMRVMNSQTGKAEYVYLFKEEDPQQAEVIKQKAKQQIIEGTEQKDPQTGQPIPGSGQPKYQHVLNMAEIKSSLDLTVATASTVSISKVATYEQSIQLFQIGAIDQQALLDAADYPNKAEVLERMQQAQQQAAQAQGQSQQETVKTFQQGEIQKEQTASKGDIQQEQLKGQTTMQKAQLDNQTRLQVEQMKQQGGLIKEQIKGAKGSTRR